MEVVLVRTNKQKREEGQLKKVRPATFTTGIVRTARLLSLRLALAVVLERKLSNKRCVFSAEITPTCPRKCVLHSSQLTRCIVLFSCERSPLI